MYVLFVIVEIIMVMYKCIDACMVILLFSFYWGE